jgi:DnaJ-class molecular chaperone
MARSHYEILGVPRDADLKTIKKSYRELARKYHPDHNQGDPQAEERFKEVGRAYEVLSDTQKRSMYDEFGEDAEKIGFDAEKARAYRQWRSTGGQPGPGFDGMGGVDMEDLLSSLFGGGMGGAGTGGGRARARGPRRGRDVEASLTIDFTTATLGGERLLEAPQLGKLNVRIPPGVKDGGSLRLKGKGQASPNGGPAGDLILELRVTPHPVFSRDGDNLRLELPITLGEALRGGSVDVPTLTSTVRLRIPPGTQTGSTLRVRGKGVERRDAPPGDLLVTVKVVLPKVGDAEVGEAIEALEALYTSDVREGLAPYRHAAA